MLLETAIADSMFFAREAIVWLSNSVRVIGFRFLHPDRNGRFQCPAIRLLDSMIDANRELHLRDRNVEA